MLMFVLLVGGGPRLCAGLFSQVCCSLMKHFAPYYTTSWLVSFCRGSAAPRLMLFDQRFHHLPQDKYL